MVALINYEILFRPTCSKNPMVVIVRVSKLSFSPSLSLLLNKFINLLMRVDERGSNITEEIMHDLEYYLHRRGLDNLQR